MCGDYCKPCRKTAVLAKGDDFEILQSYEGEVYAVRIGAHRYFIGDCYIEHHIPGVFIQLVSTHGIDKAIVKWLANLDNERMFDFDFFVRKELKNRDIPYQTITNRVRRLYREGHINNDYVRHAEMTDKGWRTFCKNVVMTKMAA